MTGTKKQPTLNDIGVDLEDYPLAVALLPYLKGGLLRTSGRGWLRYDPETGVWEEIDAAGALGMVMRAVKAYGKKVIEGTQDLKDSEVARLFKLLSTHKGRSVLAQVEDLVAAKDEIFDHAGRDIIVAANGVVNLASGELRPFDPGLYMTKRTPFAYVPGASHEDWARVLECLSVPVRDWLQLRFGQALTGHPPDDDKIIFLSNGGSGAKSTLINGVTLAAGQYQSVLSEKVLSSNPDAHSTEMTTLQGLRLAYVEELPEGRSLSAKRLKDLAGTAELTARRMRRDSVTWEATHSLFITTNHLPRVPETERAVWRRALHVDFPLRYVDRVEDIVDPDTDRLADTRLRPAIKSGHGGRAEAVLAWLVAGAMRWYAAGCAMGEIPAEVEAATRRWQGEVDVVGRFIEDRLRFDPESRVAVSDVLTLFNLDRKAEGARAWSRELFVPRFDAHELIARAPVWKKRTESHAGIDRAEDDFILAPLPKKVRVWEGLGFQ